MLLASCYGMVKKFPTNEKTKINTEYYALTKNLGERLLNIDPFINYLQYH